MTSELPRNVLRWALAAFLVAAGIAHFVMPNEFLAQVPPWMPARRMVVAVSGVAEILLGVGLLVTRRHRHALGVVLVVFFAVIWVGNISQAITATSGFGLTTDAGRWTRVAFQPVFMVWAWWATRPAPHGNATSDERTLGHHNPS